jgi:hypothetical protein
MLLRCACSLVRTHRAHSANIRENRKDVLNLNRREVNLSRGKPKVKQQKIEKIDRWE